MNKKFLTDNIVLVIPDGWRPNPLDCPVCNCAFRSREDVINYEKFKCCLDCDVQYRYPNKDKWKNGWRPPKESIKPKVIHNYNIKQGEIND